MLAALWKIPTACGIHEIRRTVRIEIYFRDKEEMLKTLVRKESIETIQDLRFWVVTAFPIILFAFAFVMFREYDVR